MRYGRELLGIGMTAALVVTASACGSDTEPSPRSSAFSSTEIVPSPSLTSSPTMGPVVPSPSESLPSSTQCPAKADEDKMYLLNTYTEDVDKQVGELQARIGIAATKNLVSMPNFSMQIDAKPTNVSINIPENPQSRCQVIYFTAKSENAGKVFKSLGYPELADTQVSTTAYSVVKKGGKLIMDGISVSVVGQETDGVGLYQNIATERCQALELTTDTVASKLYDAEKEAVCNSQGIATDVAMVNGVKATYAMYLKRMADNPELGPDVNPTGKTITYPVLSKAQFEGLKQSLGSAGLLEK